MIRLSIQETSAVITNVNQRVEKNGPDGKDVGFDVDIECKLPIEFLNKFSEGADINYDELFYDKNGTLNQSGILKLVFDRKYEEHNLKLSLDTITKDGVTIEDVTIKKFSAGLDAGMTVNLHFQAQCHANDEQMVFLRQALIRDSILVQIIEPAQQDMLDDSEAA